jgi:hypothetical protein
MDSETGCLTIYCDGATLASGHLLCDESDVSLCVDVTFACNPLLPRILSPCPDRTTLHGRHSLLVPVLQTTTTADTRLHALLQDAALLQVVQLFVWAAPDGSYDTHTVSMLPFADCTPSQTAVYEAACAVHRATEPVLWMSSAPATVPWKAPAWSEQELASDTPPNAGSSKKTRGRARLVRAADNERRCARAAKHWERLQQVMLGAQTRRRARAAFAAHVCRTEAAEVEWVRVSRLLLKPRLPRLPTSLAARFLERRWWISTRLHHATVICVE